MFQSGNKLLNKYFIISLSIILVSVQIASASQIIDRTYFTDTYDNFDGTNTIFMYNDAVNILVPNGTYQPFEDTVEFQWNNETERYEFFYEGVEINITPYIKLDKDYKKPQKQIDATEKELMKLLAKVEKLRGKDKYGHEITKTNKLETFSYVITSNYPITYNGDVVYYVNQYKLSFNDLVVKNPTLNFTFYEDEIEMSNLKDGINDLDPTVTLNITNIGGVSRCDPSCSYGNLQCCDANTCGTNEIRSYWNYGMSSYYGKYVINAMLSLTFISGNNGIPGWYGRLQSHNVSSPIFSTCPGDASCSTIGNYGLTSIYANITPYARNQLNNSQNLYFALNVNPQTGSSGINRIYDSTTTYVELTYDVGPNITYVNITPSIAYYNDTLNCSTLIIDDYANLSTNFSWYKDGVLNTTSTINCSNNTICYNPDGVQGTKWQNWTCVVRAFNGMSYTTLNNSINISNSPPNAPTLISPANGTLMKGVPDFQWALLTCYQESMNTSNQTGIDGDCGLNYSGDIAVVANGSGVLVYINYSKPTNNSITQAIWKIKLGNDINPTPYYINIPNACYNQSKLQLRVYSFSRASFGDPLLAAYTECYDGSTWQRIGHDSNANPSCFSGTSSASNGIIAINDGNWATGRIGRFGTIDYVTSGTCANGTFWEEAMEWVIGDPDGDNISNYQFYLNETYNQTLMGTNLSLALPDGIWTWYVIANDSFNISGPSEVWELTIDNTAPTILNTSLTPNDQNVGSNITIQANVIDTNGVSSVWASIWSGVTTWWSGVLNFISGDTWEVNVTVEQNWTHQLNYTIYANDSVNNIGNTTNPFQVNHAPIISNVTITPPSAGANTLITCTGTYYDEDGDSESGSTYKWFRNGGLVETTKTTTNTYNEGDNMTCEYTSSDSKLPGIPVNSSILTLGSFGPGLWNGDTNLTSDINCSGYVGINGACLYTNSSNITLDCQGHSIFGDYTLIGILLDTTVTNNTLRNCTIKWFNMAIEDRGSNNNMYSNTLLDSTNSLNFSSTGSNFSYNYIETNTGGVTLTDTGSNNIYSNNLLYSALAYYSLTGNPQTIDWFTELLEEMTCNESSDYVGLIYQENTTDNWINNSFVVPAAQLNTYTLNCTTRTNTAYHFDNIANAQISFTTSNTAPSVIQTTIINATIGHSFNITTLVQDPDYYNGTDIVSVNITSTLGSCIHLSNSSSVNNYTITYQCTSTTPGYTNISITFTDRANATAVNNQQIHYNNNAPGISEISISTPPIYVNDTLRGYCRGSDIDGDNVSYTIIWYLNGVLDYTTTTGYFNPAILQSIVYPGTLVKHQNWTFSCKSNDSELASAYYNSSTIEIQNTPPTTPTNITYNLPYVLSNLIANASGSTDLNSDVITYYYEFYNVNKSITRQAKSTNNTYYVLVADAHDTIRVRAWANDGENESASYYEVFVEVQNTPPTTPVMTFPYNGLLINQQTLNYTYSSTDLDNDTITYQIYVDGLNVINTTNTNQLITAGDGHHNWTVIADDGYVSTNGPTYNYTIDTTIPVILITDPPNLHNTMDNTPSITLYASDDLTPPIDYLMYVDGSFNGQFGQIPNASTTTFDISPALADGNHTITAQGTDQATNSANNSINISIYAYCLNDTDPYDVTVGICTYENLQWITTALKPDYAVCCALFSNQTYCSVPAPYSNGCNYCDQFPDADVCKPFIAGGAGLAKFISYLGVPLFVLIIGIIVAGLIYIIGMAIASLVREQ